MFEICTLLDETFDEWFDASDKMTISSSLLICVFSSILRFVSSFFVVDDADVDFVNLHWACMSSRSSTSSFASSIMRFWIRWAHDKFIVVVKMFVHVIMIVDWSVKRFYCWYIFHRAKGVTFSIRFRNIESRRSWDSLVFVFSRVWM